MSHRVWLLIILFLGFTMYLLRMYRWYPFLVLLILLVLFYIFELSFHAQKLKARKHLDAITARDRERILELLKEIAHENDYSGKIVRYEHIVRHCNFVLSTAPHDPYSLNSVLTEAKEMLILLPLQKILDEARDFEKMKEWVKSLSAYEEACLFIEKKWQEIKNTGDWNFQKSMERKLDFIKSKIYQIKKML